MREVLRCERCALLKVMLFCVDTIVSAFHTQHSMMFSRPDTHAGLLHTILFTRALGMVVPREVESELLDISYVAVSDPEIEAVLEDRLSSICAAVERAPRTPSASQQPSLASSLSGAASKPVAAAVEQPSQVCGFRASCLLDTQCATW